MRLPGAGPKAGYVIGLGLLVLAAVIAFDAARMQVPPAYSAYGPQIFPYIAVVALTASALFLLWQTATGRPEAVSADTDAPEWAGIVAISVGLLAQVFLIERLGFVLSAALLFFLVAWGFRSRRPLRDAVVALLVSLVTYLVFTRLLDLQLPPGIFEGIL